MYCLNIVFKYRLDVLLFIFISTTYVNVSIYLFFGLSLNADNLSPPPITPD
jgi:hypothetical protein